MDMNEANKNQWLTCPAGSILTICDMLVELDRRDLIPTDMRTALVEHSEALIDLIPNYITANANLMAQVHAEPGGYSDNLLAAHMCWGMAFMSDALNGLHYLTRLERERKEFPETHAAMRKAYGANVALVSGNA